MAYDQPQVAWALTQAQALTLGQMLISVARGVGNDGTVMINNGMEPNDGALYVDGFNVTHGHVTNEWVSGVEVMDPSHM